MRKIIHHAAAMPELVLGTILTAAAFGLIIIPMNFCAAGVSGTAILLNSVLPVSVSVWVLVINAAFLLMAWLCIGKAFLIKTVVSSLLFPAALDFFLGFRVSSIESDPFVCVILAGILLGAGSGLVLRSGASTGGFNIPAVLLNRKYGIPVGQVMNVIDALVIFLQIWNKSPLQMIYGILVITVSAFLVDRVVSFGRGEAQITIISPENDSIRAALLGNADVGLTSFKAETGYLQENRSVIVSIVPCVKVPEIKRVVMDIDPTAFVIISQVQSVLGKGYTLSRAAE